jgi:hypothetical protein
VMKITPEIRYKTGNLLVGCMRSTYDYSNPRNRTHGPVLVHSDLGGY